MSLRPLLQIATENGSFRSLATAVRAGSGVDASMSPGVRPYLLASPGRGRVRARRAARPDRHSRRPLGARDLARELGAYLAPRRVRYYPSRGTGYESHVAPPPHLVGLRIAALDALTGAEAAPVVVASAVALAEAVPDASLRPIGFALERGEEVDLDAVAMRLVECGYERVDQVEERGQFAVRGGILDVFPATEERAARIELFGDEVESAALVLDLHPALSRRRRPGRARARGRARRRASRARRARAGGGPCPAGRWRPLAPRRRRGSPDGSLRGAAGSVCPMPRR